MGTEAPSLGRPDALQSRIVYFRGSSSLLSLSRCTRSASPTLSASWSSPSVRDRGHKMNPPQTNATPITISAIPRTSIFATAKRTPPASSADTGRAPLRCPIVSNGFRRNGEALARKVGVQIYSQLTEATMRERRGRLAPACVRPASAKRRKLSAMTRDTWLVTISAAQCIT